MGLAFISLIYEGVCGCVCVCWCAYVCVYYVLGDVYESVGKMVPSNGVVFIMFKRKDHITPPSSHIYDVVSQIYQKAPSS